MTKPQSNLGALAGDPKAAQLLQNKELLKRLLDSPDTKKLMQLLSQKGGESLKSAAGAAVKGDASQLQRMVEQVMESREGAQVIGRIRQSVPHKTP